MVLDTFQLYPPPKPAILTCAGTEFRDEENGAVITAPGSDVPLLRLTDEQWLLHVLDVHVVVLRTCVYMCTCQSQEMSPK